MDFSLAGMDKSCHTIIMGKTAHAEKGDWGFWHYLPYSKEDERLGMVCTTAGSQEIKPGTVYPPNKEKHPVLFRSVAEGRILSEYQIVYIINGKGVFSSAGKTWDVIPGSMLLILPGLMHSYKPAKETGWLEYWVGFKGSYFDKLSREGFLSEERLFFDIGHYDYLITVFNRIFDEVRSQKPLYQIKACSGVLTLISEMLSRSRRQEQPDFYQKIVDEAKYLMETHIDGAINLPNIASQIGISTSRLNEVFKQFTSMTPYQYYIHIKIHKAEELLSDDNISVKEAAWRLGFDDQYYFSRLFKHKTGLAPSGWKK
jgi:AraC-like DNA-binding protein